MKMGTAATRASVKMVGKVSNFELFFAILATAECSDKEEDEFCVSSTSSEEEEKQVQASEESIYECDLFG